MCLGIPGRITEVADDAPLRMGTVDFGGVQREICLAHVPEAVVGDYVIVHVGFAISRLDEEEAQATLGLLREMGELKRELGEEAPGGDADRRLRRRPDGPAEPFTGKQDP